ncbi:DEAD-domain-containing protein [Neoconidiobolus thromboides FSU 785]|nr:DEAD-domain-containing protein [Neoconidiobolus thromboides FSU 785]
MPKLQGGRKDRVKADLEEIEKLILETKEITPPETNKFTELPISSKTIRGLKESNFLEMTEIQKLALPKALSRKDVLAAAKTGSGKTLAFLIPVIENLYLNKWGSQDGLGALIISPTRELAVQIFGVLCKIGKHHSLSAGLVIGGKQVKHEKERISKMNILIGTPGRLLQHMDETSGFNADNLQVLVLDEADRILDMGFSKSVNSIIEFLPKERQTMLFSATQTKSVKDLSRLSLNQPEYVGVYEKNKFSTPKNLEQFYMTVELPKKLDTLYSFIKTHLKNKTIVFMSSCKQVRYIFETFCKLQPGIPLLHLHGKQKQSKRIEVYEKYIKMPECVLFCTDIAARGLDFPKVEWVIQLDCPEDVETYIHRIGRTARYESSGSSLLFLLPSEMKMVEEIEKKEIKINKIAAKKSQLKEIQHQLQAFCFKDPEIKYIGQKAFVSYMKSIYLQKNKQIFDVHALPAEQFAESLGLPGTPNIKFFKKKDKKMNESKVGEIINEKDNEEEEKKKSTDKQTKTKVEKLFLKKNRTVLAEHYNKLVDRESDNESLDDDFMKIKRRDHALDNNDDATFGKSAEEVAAMNKRQILNAKQKALKGGNKNEKMVFDDEGNAHQLYELEDGQEFLENSDIKKIQKEYIEQQNMEFKLADIHDKQLAKDKKKEKKLKLKAKFKEDYEDTEMQVILGNDDDVSDDENNSDSDNENNNSSDNENDDDKILVDYSKNKRLSKEKEDNKKNKKTKVIELDQPITIEDQEALALKLLNL